MNSPRATLDFRSEIPGKVLGQTCKPLLVYCIITIQGFPSY